MGRQRGLGNKNAVKLVDGRRVYLYLDAQTIERAGVIGGGNISEAVRAAVSRMWAELTSRKSDD